MGCPVCYDTFQAELKPTLVGLQDGCRHVGKVPKTVCETICEEVVDPVGDMTREMDAAVAREDYEAAAQLRDKISSEKVAGERRGEASVGGRAAEN